MTGPDKLPPPDAVRVWRGFRAESMAPADFFARLGSVFIPATVEMQIEAGLEAYLPTVPAELPGKPAGVPDETAILFWESQDTYQQGFERLAVRTYTLTHGAVYTSASRADFPLPFAGQLELDQPYYLANAPADWMHGEVVHLIGSREDTMSSEDFAAAVARNLAAAQTEGALDGGIVCVSSDYLVYWQLGGNDDLSGLSSCCAWSETFHPETTALEGSLWAIWPGLSVVSGDSLNMQFTRRWEHGRR